MWSGRRTTIIVLLTIMAAAVVLRTYGLRSLVYCNPDEALWAYFLVNNAKLSVLNLDLMDNGLARILSWDYGWPVFVFYLAYVKGLDALHIPISEATLPIPLALVSALICLLVFRLGLELRTVTTGIIAALLVAIMPLTVIYGRSIGGFHHLGSSLFFLLSVLMLVRYLRDPTSRRQRLWAGLAVALYVCADLQFPIGLVVLGALLLIWPKDQQYRDWQGLKRLIFKPELLVPPLVLFCPYVLIYIYACRLGYPDQTYLGTMLAEHNADWGLHVSGFFSDLRHNMGLPLVVSLILVPSAIAASWTDNRLKWLTLWAGLTAFPFLVAVSREVTMSYGYHEHLIVALALLVAIALGAVRTRWLAATLATIVVCGTLATTLGGVLSVKPFTVFWHLPGTVYGGVAPNYGMKTAGYWVRENVGPDQRLFVENDPAVAYWYLGRPAITGGYGHNEQYRREFLGRVRDEVEVAILPAYSREWAMQNLVPYGFAGHIVIRSQGEDVQDIFTRWAVEEELDTEVVDPLYDRKYNSLSTILPTVGPYVPEKPIVVPRPPGRQ